MSALYKLPDDIVLRIINLLSSNAYRSLGNWKKALPLLAVCRQWRAFAVNILYRSAIIGDGSVTYASMNQALQITHGTIKAGSLKSNVALIKSNGFQNFVTSITATLTSEHPSPEKLQYIRDTLAYNNTTLWPSVTGLLMSFCGNEHNNIQQGTDEDKDIIEAEKIACCLLEWLPNIDEFLVWGNSSCIIIRRFLQTFIKGCFEKLSTFISTMDALLSHNFASRKLNCYYIHNSDNEQQLPKINPQIIQRMMISTFEIIFPWRKFSYISACEGRVVFENLVSLNLVRIGDNVQDFNGVELSNSTKNHPKLVFPALERLLIVSTSLRPETVDLFIASPLKVVAFGGVLEGLQLMRALKFQRLDILRIEIVSKFPDNNDNLYEITNSIMHDVGFDSAVAFIMDVQRIKIMPAMANWVNLTHLAINPELLTELELDLISMMPRLVYLKIKALDIGGRVSGEAAHKHFTDLQKKYATPLYTSKITVVVLEFGGEMSEELDLMAIELFRQYLPSLIHAHVEHITEE